MRFFLSVGADWAAVLFDGYLELMVWKRGDREKEKVCFEADLLTGDWFNSLKGVMDYRQYLSFIKIIIIASANPPRFILPISPHFFLYKK